MRIGSIAAYGMTQAVQRLEVSAARTARSGSTSDAIEEASSVDPVDPVHEIVEQISAKNDFSANLSVLKTADEMTKRLLDIRV